MRVILKQDVKGLGKKGQALTVAEGYGRNFLLPRGLAVEASEGAVKAMQEEKKVQQIRQERVLKEAQALRDRLEGKTVTVSARVGENGRLFGSITSKDVAAALSKLVGSEIDKRSVELKDPIRTLGAHPVSVKLGHDLVAKVTVQIVEG